VPVSDLLPILQRAIAASGERTYLERLLDHLKRTLAAARRTYQHLSHVQPVRAHVRHSMKTHPRPTLGTRMPLLKVNCGTTMAGLRQKDRRLAFPVRGLAFYPCMRFRRGAERGSKPFRTRGREDKPR
jgi:hypothetical protein